MPDVNDQVTRLVPATTVNVTGETFTVPRGERERVYQATITGTSGAVSATVTLQGSCDGANWVTIGSALSLSGTLTDTQAIESAYPWPMVRAVVASLTGTGATATVLMGI